MANRTLEPPNNDGNGKLWAADNGDGVPKISETLNMLLADVFTLYFKTKNFHWHVSGPHFLDYYLLLNEHTFMREAHFVCGGYDDVASMGLLENWIDEAERRIWFLFECGRKSRD
jgi:DNA-binding ferritin-like protein